MNTCNLRLPFLCVCFRGVYFFDNKKFKIFIYIQLRLDVMLFPNADYILRNSQSFFLFRSIKQMKLHLVYYMYIRLEDYSKIGSLIQQAILCNVTTADIGNSFVLLALMSFLVYFSWRSLYIS